MWRRKRRLHLLVRRFPKRRIENSSAPGGELTNDDPVCSSLFVISLFVSSWGKQHVIMLIINSMQYNTHVARANKKSLHYLFRLFL